MTGPHGTDATGPQPATPPNRVMVVDFNMPFGSMIVFMLKWAIAAIPAMLILIALGAVLSVLFASVAAGIVSMAGPFRLRQTDMSLPRTSSRDLVVTVRPTSTGWQLFNENKTAWRNCSLSIDGHSADIPALAGDTTLPIAAADFSNGGAPRPEAVMELDVSMLCRSPETQHATIHLSKQ